MLVLVLGLAAALGTLLGVFVGMPAVGFLLWPLTRAACRLARIEIDPHDEHDPVMKLEGSLAAGLGMALGVFASAALVGIVAAASGSSLTMLRALLSAAAASAVAGTVFGSLWRFGYRRRSMAPFLIITAVLAGLTAAASAAWW